MGLKSFSHIPTHTHTHSMHYKHFFLMFDVDVYVGFIFNLLMRNSCYYLPISHQSSIEWLDITEVQKPTRPWTGSKINKINKTD